MRKLVALTMIFSALNGYADKLHSYEKIKEAVANGQLVRIFVDYAQCSGPTKNYKMANYNSAYTPNEIAINNDAGYMAASMMHFTVNHPQFPNQPIYEFNRYTIASNGDVSISLIPLNAIDFTPLSNKITFKCKINESAQFFIENK
ncbi:VirK family protein [Legionella quateirensis]|uniref:VirK protein n=1 Tax=Legionella quateirensis TaxID=45072 RepID=A0A378KTE8_9GAMM|nr:VirK family protein [Legionella quateirensis]KTD54702.1 VirK protein [Legionella quateirensis]STY16881.1 VirK protein [Legionella quateirensis]